MQFENKDLEYIEKLARIKLTVEERKEIAGQLSKILDYVDKLKKVKIDNNESDVFLQKREKKNILRPDKIRKSLAVEDALKNAPQRKGDFFKVPKIIS